MVDSTTAKKTAFKVGFLTKLAEAGVTPTELFEKVAIRQQGDDPGRIIYDLAKGGLGEVSHVGRQAVCGLTGQLSKVPGLAAYGLTALPTAIGGGLGALEQLTEAPTSLDPEIIRQAEELGLYKQLAKEIKSRVTSRAGAY
jgi:hypothetical protein